MTAFALKGDLDTTRIVSNMFRMEWPPRSGAFRDWPEVDRAEWFSVAEARVRILSGQMPMLDRLIERTGIAPLAISRSSG